MEFGCGSCDAPLLFFSYAPTRILCSEGTTLLISHHSSRLSVSFWQWWMTSVLFSVLAMAWFWFWFRFGNGEWPLFWFSISALVESVQFWPDSDLSFRIACLKLKCQKALGNKASSNKAYSIIMVLVCVSIIIMVFLIFFLHEVTIRVYPSTRLLKLLSLTTLLFTKFLWVRQNNHVSKLMSQSMVSAQLFLLLTILFHLVVF